MIFYSLKILYLRVFIHLLFSITLIFNCNKTYSKSSEEIIKESISQYHGECPCPYSIMSNGKKCGKKSAYSKSDDFLLICYVSDIVRKEKKNQKTNVKIVDGDTLHIKGVKYRLHGIDAPEIDQMCEINKKSYYCGLHSKSYLESLVVGKQIICKQKDIDRYKRIVAICFVDGLNLNKQMVKSGWALAYRYYSKDYVNDEIFAEKKKMGIWRGSFAKPYEWRKKN